jgi:fused signal recognition particle receptor
MDGSTLIVVVALALLGVCSLLVTLVVLFAPPAVGTSLPKAPTPPVLPAPLPAPVAPVAPAAAAPVAPAAAAPVAPAVATRSWFARLSDGLTRTRGQLLRSLDDLFLSKDAKATREETLERLFEILISADVGVATSEKLVASVKDSLSGSESTDPERLRSSLRQAILGLLAAPSLNAAATSTSTAAAIAAAGTLEAPTASCHVVMMVGVNGVGKTTTTGKLAFKARSRGLGVVVGAADTFRAAAVEQLAVWADRSGAKLVRLKEGSDPASVAYETVRLAKAEGLQLAIVDTAGRLHNRNDLMQELAKVRRVMGKEIPEAPHEVLLVVDATTGQNALQQARVFREISGVTGVVLTKLDGTAKGGVALAIVAELGLPIRYVGVGESVDDLELFRAEEFVDALFG